MAVEIFLLAICYGQDAKPINFDYSNHNERVLYEVCKELNATNEPLFILARLGDGENNPLINEARLKQVFSEQKHCLAWRNHILARGDKIKGDGGLELYLRGKIIGFLAARRGCYIAYDSEDCNLKNPIIKKGKLNRLRFCQLG
ncbi:MAG: hypothetical protein JNM09_12795 [Blastocatellia bacterium]|nr:hypothetical protein [Blastocatellia bacterium]